MNLAHATFEETHKNKIKSHGQYQVKPNTPQLQLFKVINCKPQKKRMSFPGLSLESCKQIAKEKSKSTKRQISQSPFLFNPIRLSSIVINYRNPSSSMSSQTPHAPFKGLQINQISLQQGGILTKSELRDGFEG